MVLTLTNLTSEVLQRPNFANFTSAQLIAAPRYLQAVNSSTQKFYETNGNKLSYYEKTTPNGAPITLPAGVAYGANGKIYELTTVTTGPLPADYVRAKGIYVLGDTGMETPSASTYDTGAVVGSGIPDGSTNLTLTAVFHRQTGMDTAALLAIYAGTTAQGATPKLRLIYQRALAANVAAGSDPIDIPADWSWYSQYLGILSGYLQQYMGIS